MQADAPAQVAGLETKYCALGSAGRAESGRIEGYASLFDLLDEGGDEVAPGAFAASLARRGAGVKLLWQHDPAQPIGVWESLAEDGRGLKVAGRLLTEVRRGAEAAALLAAGAVDGLSIGYRTVRAEKTARGRRLLEIDLWEVSLVTFPMLPQARAIGAVPVAGDDDDAGAARLLAAALREARGGI